MTIVRETGARLAAADGSQLFVGLRLGRLARPSMGRRSQPQPLIEVAHDPLRLQQERVDAIFEEVIDRQRGQSDDQPEDRRQQRRPQRDPRRIGGISRGGHSERAAIDRRSHSLARSQHQRHVQRTARGARGRGGARGVRGFVVGVRRHADTARDAS